MKTISLLSTLVLSFNVYANWTPAQDSKSYDLYGIKRVEQTSFGAVEIRVNGKVHPDVSINFSGELIDEKYCNQFEQYKVVNTDFFAMLANVTASWGCQYNSYEELYYLSANIFDAKQVYKFIDSLSKRDLQIYDAEVKGLKISYKIPSENFGELWDAYEKIIENRRTKDLYQKWSNGKVTDAEFSFGGATMEIAKDRNDKYNLYLNYNMTKEDKCKSLESLNPSVVFNETKVQMNWYCSKYSDIDSYFAYATPRTDAGKDYVLKVFKKSKAVEVYETTDKRSTMMVFSALGFTKEWNRLNNTTGGL